MDSHIVIIAILLWSAVLLNLLITLALVRKMGAVYSFLDKRPELPIGVSAPDFEAETLTAEKVTLDTYLGQATVFVFIEPHCAPCRLVIPELEMLAPLMKTNSRTNLVLVSEGTPAETRKLAREFHITCPLLVAPRRKYNFVRDYNSGGLRPFFCLISDHGIVQARAVVGQDEWFTWKQRWAPTAEGNRLTTSHKRYS